MKECFCYIGGDIPTKRRVEQMMLRLCFRFESFVLLCGILILPCDIHCSLSLKTVSYSDFDSLKISSLDDFLFNVLLIDIGMCLMT